MNILGINSVWHDTSACLVQDGKIIAAAEEERFTRQKHGKKADPKTASHLPFNAIAYCLSRAGLKINDIDYVGWSFRPWQRFFSNIWRTPGGRLSDLHFQLEHEISLLYYSLQLKKQLTDYYPSLLLLDKKNKAKLDVPATVKGLKPKFVDINHHLCHAASAFFVSPFEEAAVLSVDGIGEIASTWCGIGRGNKLEELYKIKYPHSLGFLFEALTEFLGFQMNNDEYKIMGMASYGKPAYMNEFKKIISLEDGGRFKINNYYTAFRLPLRRSRLAELFGPAREPGTPYEERHYDIAASLQKTLEEALLHIANHLYKTTKLENLCLAGGVALNVVANQRIFCETPFKNVFIQPASSDAGTSIGAAYYVYNQILGKPRGEAFTSAYLGPSYGNEEIEKILKRSKLPYRQSENIVNDVARLLADGKVVGWFQGALEMGPRALGSRSILADPRDPRMKDRLNEIKFREEFRPFAPVTLEEMGSRFYEDFHPDPFMLYAYKVRPEAADKIAATVHVDGTARVQSINRQQNQKYYDVIKEFERITGVPTVVNTSFNIKGKPIVCTPEHAVEDFYGCAMDALAIGDFIVSK